MKSFESLESRNLFTVAVSVSPITPDEIVNSTGQQYTSRIEMGPSGGVMTYLAPPSNSLSSSNDIWAQPLSTAGFPVGPVVRVTDNIANENLHTPSSVVFDDGSFLVSWNDPSDQLRGQKYDAAGQAVGSEFTIAAGTGGRIALMADGGFVAAYLSQNEIYIQKFKPDFDTDGLPQLIAGSSSDTLFVSDVAASPSGDVNVAFVTINGGTYHADYATMSPLGALQTTRVSRYGTVNAFPRIAVAQNNDAAITWTEFHNNKCDVYVADFKGSHQFNNSARNLTALQSGTFYRDASPVYQSNGSLAIVYGQYQTNGNNLPTTGSFVSMFTDDGKLLMEHFPIATNTDSRDLGSIFLNNGDLVVTNPVFLSDDIELKHLRPATVVTATSGDDDLKVFETPGSYTHVTHGSFGISFTPVIGDLIVSSDGGNDTISVSLETESNFHNISIDAGAGDDRVSGSKFGETIVLGDGRDYAYGNDGDDQISGGTGADHIWGGNGTDRIKGNSGSDYIFGEAGSDRLYGDAGNDSLEGGSGTNRIYGGAGNDILVGHVRSDSLYGDAGNDRLYGGKSADLLDGGAGDDWADFQEGDTSISVEVLN